MSNILTHQGPEGIAGARIWWVGGDILGFWNLVAKHIKNCFKLNFYTFGSRILKKLSAGVIEARS